MKSYSLVFPFFLTHSFATLFNISEKNVKSNVRNIETEGKDCLNFGAFWQKKAEQGKKEEGKRTEKTMKQMGLKDFLAKK
ncbi:hypothetical protein [[Clostridium] aminophilum]|uniref:hypothetical protein n=1 Tax=[Clostridium] aminophilum TaxID=1526 RepID=UPI0009438A7C|nr:hypothetical protein [[Clostridium] aminophilum]